MTQLNQSFFESEEQMSKVLTRAETQKAHFSWLVCLLGASNERRGRNAAGDSRDERSALHH